MGSDVLLQLVGVKITNRGRIMLKEVGIASQKHYHSISGEGIHFYVKNNFLAQKPTMLYF